MRISLSYPTVTKVMADPANPMENNYYLVDIPMLANHEAQDENAYPVQTNLSVRVVFGDPDEPLDSIIARGKAQMRLDALELAELLTVDS